MHLADARLVPNQPAGSGRLARYDDVICLVGADPVRIGTTALFEACRNHAGDGRSLVDKIAGLVERSGTNLPPFVVVTRHGDGVLVAVHGPVSVVAQQASGPLRLDGGEPGTWTATEVLDAAYLSATVPGGIDEAVPALVDLQRGISPATGFVMLPAGVSPGDLGLDRRGGPADPLDQSPPAPPAPPAGAAPIAVEAEPEPEPPAPALPAPVAVEPGRPEPAPAPLDRPLRVDPTGPVPVVTGPVAGDPSAPGPVAPGPAGPVPAGPVPAGPLPPPAPVPGPVAAVPEPPAPAPAPVPSGPPAAEERAVPVGWARPAGEPAPADFRLVDLRPTEGPPAAEPLPVVANPDPGSPGPATPHVPAGAVLVEGVRCSRDHFNDPRARYCAVCGIAMFQASVVLSRGPRPPLGVVVLDSGESFPLVRDRIVGREPVGHPDVVADTADPLQPTRYGPRLSRVHARISLDGWNVVLVDEGSTNGTFVWDETNRQWAPVPAGTRRVLRPGDHLAFGDLTATFETSIQQ